MNEFLSMGGYGFYVWLSYAVFFGVLAIDALMPLLRRRRVLADLRARIRRDETRAQRR